jgi:hypothetical protein
MAGLLKGTGWTSTASGIFEEAGQLAAGVKNWFSGNTKANRDAIKAEQSAQGQAIAQAQLGEQKSETAKLKVFAFFKQYGLWLGIAIGVIVLVIILLRVFKKKGHSGASRRSPRRTRIKTKSISRIRSRGTRSRSVRKSKGSRKGFRRRIGNTVYTSPKSWSEAMRRRRKK